MDNETFKKLVSQGVSGDALFSELGLIRQVVGNAGLPIRERLADLTNNNEFLNYSDNQLFDVLVYLYRDNMKAFYYAIDVPIDLDDESTVIMLTELKALK